MIYLLQFDEIVFTYFHSRYDGIEKKIYENNIDASFQKNKTFDRQIPLGVPDKYSSRSF